MLRQVCSTLRNVYYLRELIPIKDASFRVIVSSETFDLTHVSRLSHSMALTLLPEFPSHLIFRGPTLVSQICGETSFRRWR